MIVREWDNLIVSDNVLTNLPISRLSSIPAADDGLLATDRILISRLCDLSNMTDTGYMSYNAALSDVSSFAYEALGVSDILYDIGVLSTELDSLLVYREMLRIIAQSAPSAVVDIYDAAGKFNPFVISSIYAVSGVLLEELGGYRFSDAMQNIFNWKKFSSISATNGYFDNIHATNGYFSRLYINGGEVRPMEFAMSEADYQRAAKKANTVYFTYVDPS